MGRVCHFTNITTTNRHQDNNLVLIGVTRHVPFGFIKALDISRRVLAFYFFARMEEHIRDLQTRLNQHDEDVKQSREHQGDTRRLERQLREIQTDMAGQGECKRLAGQLQELRSAMECQDNDIMQLKDTMKQGMVKVNTPLGHFLHFPQPIVGDLFNSKKLSS